MDKSLYVEASVIEAEYNLPKNLCKPAASKAFLYYLNRDDLDNAIKFLRVYKLKRKDLLKHILFIFNEKMDKGNYIASTLIASKFRLPREKIMPAVKRAYDMNMQLGYIKQADDLKRRFMLREKGLLGRVLEKIS